MNIIITKHARDRFLERHPDPNFKKQPNETIMKLLDRAIPIEFSKEHKVKRLLNNGFEDADYLYNSGWIFVCNKEDPKTLITVERQEDRIFGRDLFKLCTVTNNL